jgi:hypothetical protein
MPIQQQSLVEQHLGRWNPGDLAFLTALTARDRHVRLESVWQRRESCSSWPDEMQPCCRVVLDFEGVVGFKLDWGGAAAQVMGFEIEDISDRQWESIRFLVNDWENDVIELSCASITVVEVAPLGLLRYARE